MRKKREPAIDIEDIPWYDRPRHVLELSFKQDREIRRRRITGYSLIFITWFLAVANFTIAVVQGGRFELWRSVFHGLCLGAGFALAYSTGGMNVARRRVLDNIETLKQAVELADIARLETELNDDLPRIPVTVYYDDGTEIDATGAYRVTGPGLVQLIDVRDAAGEQLDPERVDNILPQVPFSEIFGEGET